MTHNLNDFLIKTSGFKKCLQNSIKEDLIEQKNHLIEFKKQILDSIHLTNEEEDQEKIKELKELIQQLNQLEKEFQKKIDESDNSTTTELCGKFIKILLTLFYRILSRFKSFNMLH
jgi:isoleucyl-tRNA synthetase